VSATRMQRDPGAQPVAFEGTSAASMPSLRKLRAGTTSSAGSASSTPAVAGAGTDVVAVRESGGGPPQAEKTTSVKKKSAYREPVRRIAPPDYAESDPHGHQPASRANNNASIRYRSSRAGSIRLARRAGM